VKKNDQDTSLFNTDIARSKDFEVDKIKTTNVNILLNRVRLDQKRTLKKRIIFSIIFFIFTIIFTIFYFFQIKKIYKNIQNIISKALIWETIPAQLLTRNKKSQLLKLAFFYFK